MAKKACMQNLLPHENQDLHKIIDLLNKGHNVFITGFAGTGKSYNLQRLKEYYGKRLVLTSTTGISAVNINGQTIHSWSGTSTMETPIDEFIDLILTNDFGTFGKAKQRIKSCKLLAIDEISMLSAYQFEYLDKVFRAVKNNKKPFGGIQLILIGDFLQLPPVIDKNSKKNLLTKNLFCFQSPIWEELKLKNILLTKIYRQENYNFAKMLCDFRLGEISDKHLKLLTTRFFNENETLKNKLHIFPRRNQANYYNSEQLNKLPTPEQEFKAYHTFPNLNEQDDTQKHKRELYQRLNSICQAEYILKLKVGCRVMLLANLDVLNGLANGSCGIVKELKKSSVIVQFDNGVTREIERTSFKLTEDDVTVCERFQIPLKLAYAITIHKSQGMTFDEIVINCANSFSPGQVYVALSRVKNLKGLYITSFNPRKLYPDNDARRFYLKLDKEEMQQFMDNLYK